MPTGQAQYSSDYDAWETPKKLFDQLHEEFRFTLDVAASESNTKCERYFTKKDNALVQSWQSERVFCNPPYGRELGRWVAKAFCEVYQRYCPLAVLLLPARTDVEWFHRYVYHKAEIRFIEGRLKFGGSKYNAPFPSMVVIFENPYNRRKTHGK